jgi:hypothetical protein
MKRGARPILVNVSDETVADPKTRRGDKASSNHPVNGHTIPVAEVAWVAAGRLEEAR